MTDTLKNDSVRILITLSREIGSLMTTTKLLKSKELPDEALRPIAGQANKHVYEIRKLLNTFLKDLDLSSDTESDYFYNPHDYELDDDNFNFDVDSKLNASDLSHDEAVPVAISIASDSVDLDSESEATDEITVDPDVVLDSESDTTDEITVDTDEALDSETDATEEIAVDTDDALDFETDATEETTVDIDEALDSETSTVDDLETTKNEVVAELVSDLENDVLKVGDGVHISEDATVGSLDLHAMELSSAIGGAEDAVLDLPGADVKVAIDDLDKIETVVDESILKATIDEPIHDVGPKEMSLILDDSAHDGASDEEELDLDDDF